MQLGLLVEDVLFESFKAFPQIVDFVAGKIFCVFQASLGRIGESLEFLVNRNQLPGGTPEKMFRYTFILSQLQESHTFMTSTRSGVSPSLILQAYDGTSLVFVLFELQLEPHPLKPVVRFFPARFHVQQEVVD